MPIALDTFQRLADSTRLSSRDIVVTSEDSAELGRVGRFSVTSGAKDVNVATMAAFREALKNEFGVFGEHAFDTVLASRSQTKKSLRACDVRAVMSQLEPLKEQRLLVQLGDLDKAEDLTGGCDELQVQRVLVLHAKAHESIIVGFKRRKSGSLGNLAEKRLVLLHCRHDTILLNEIFSIIPSPHPIPSSVKFTKRIVDGHRRRLLEASAKYAILFA